MCDHSQLVNPLRGGDTFFIFVTYIFKIGLHFQLRWLGFAVTSEKFRLDHLGSKIISNQKIY